MNINGLITDLETQIDNHEKKKIYKKQTGKTHIGEFGLGLTHGRKEILKQLKELKEKDLKVSSYSEKHLLRDFKQHCNTNDFGKIIVTDEMIIDFLKAKQ